MTMRARFLGFAILVGSAALGACGAGPAVVSDRLPLRKVVLYRNGIGYFERSGRVNDDHVRFRVRGSQVGDFLASLTAVERATGQRVLSAAFPLSDDAQPRPSEERTVDVQLTLTEGRHDLLVAYVVESPVWRPSYRLLLDHEGALLQGWAIVQNTSGEDWRGVDLSLAAGAPLTFQTDLATPVTPSRPMVTDRGEVIEGIVGAETALRTEAPTGSPPAPSVTAPPPAPAEPAADEEADAETGGMTGRSAGPRAGGSAGGGYGAGHASMRAPRREAAERSRSADLRRFAQQQAQRNITGNSVAGSVANLVAAATLGGTTWYHARGPATVPDRSSSLVPILNQHVPGEDAYLFRPDPAVPDSVTHPFRVARVTNRTGALLERGPVAIFAEGTFVGQGIVDPIPDGATTTVPFALDRSLAVERTTRDDTDTARLVKIVRGHITVEHYQVRRTGYRVRGVPEHAATLYVRHERVAGWELRNPPAGTENVSGAALVPVRLERRDGTPLDIEERTAVQREVDIWDPSAATALGLYLQGPAASGEASPALRRVLEMREHVVSFANDRARFERERGELQQATEEIRQNLEAIRRNPRARDLRNRLTARLGQLATQIDDLTRRIVEIDTQRSELEARVAEALRDVTLEAPPAVGPVAPPARP